MSKQIRQAQTDDQPQRGEPCSRRKSHAAPILAGLAPAGIVDRDVAVITRADREGGARRGFAWALVNAVYVYLLALAVTACSASRRRSSSSSLRPLWRCPSSRSTDGRRRRSDGEDDDRARDRRGCRVAGDVPAAHSVSAAQRRLRISRARRSRSARRSAPDSSSDPSSGSRSRCSTDLAGASRPSPSTSPHSASMRLPPD